MNEFIARHAHLQGTHIFGGGSTALCTLCEWLHIQASVPAWVVHSKHRIDIDETQ